MQDTHLIKPEGKLTRKDAHELLTLSYTSLYGMFLFFCGVISGVILNAYFSDTLFNNYFSIVLLLIAILLFIFAQKMHTQFKTRLEKMLTEIK